MAKLKEWRLSREWSFQQLVREIETATGHQTNRQTLWKLETGKIKLTTQWLERIAAAYGCKPADLLGVPPSCGSEPDAVSGSRQPISEPSQEPYKAVGGNDPLMTHVSAKQALECLLELPTEMALEVMRRARHELMARGKKR
jgi:transcriptional regulator with XRE-family HTH domain